MFRFTRVALITYCAAMVALAPEPPAPPEPAAPGAPNGAAAMVRPEIGRASCRERV